MYAQKNKVSVSLQEPRFFIDRFCNFRTIPLRIPYTLFSWTNFPKTSTGPRPIGSGGKRKGGVEVRSWDKRQVPSGNQGVPEAEARTVQRSTQGRDLRGMEAYHSAAYSLQTSSHVTANKSDRPGKPASERRRCVTSRGRGRHSSVYYTLQNFKTLCTAIFNRVVITFFLPPVGFALLRHSKCGITLGGGGGSEFEIFRFTLLPLCRKSSFQSF